jgi:hypothetical protein
LLTVTTKPIGEPALTVAASAVFVIVRLGQRTTTFAGACALPSFVVETLAELATVPHDADVVGEVTCTDLLAPEARSPNVHVSVPELIEHPATAGLIDQLVPAVVGSTSVSVTPVAVPAPPFVTVIVKPIASPALTGVASATFVSWMSAQLTVSDAEAFCGAVPFVSVTLAVLLYVLHDAEVVPLVTWALVLPVGKVDAV